MALLNFRKREKTGSAPVNGQVEAFLEDLVPCLAANYTDYEVVLVDDCSSDETVDRARSWIARHGAVPYDRMSLPLVHADGGLVGAVGSRTGHCRQWTTGCHARVRLRSAAG